MENIPTKKAKVDKYGKQVSQYCLGLPTVLRKLLEQFSTTELIELSLVNKLWNSEARSVMRERGNVAARIIHGGFSYPYQYHRLSQFASYLENMAVIPFSGINLHMSHQSGHCPISHEPLDPSHKVILDLIPWKHFSVNYHDRDRGVWGTNCPILVFVKQVLENCCGLLEELTLRIAKEQLLQPIFEGRTFPRLKYLTFETPPWCTRYDSYTSTFIKALVSRAPNLQELRVCPMDLTENILEGSSAMLVPNYKFRPLSEPICEELIDSIRLKEMQICIDREETSRGLLHEFVPMLLNRSCNTLKTLLMDILFAVPLMCYGICLESVTTLQLRLNEESLKEVEPSILAIAKSFDFTRVFPKLNQVEIFDDDNDDLEFSSDVVSEFVQKANAVLSRALPDRATNIKLLYLVLLWSTLKDSTLCFLAQMFPNVKTVRTREQQKGASFTNLREHFPYLEEVIDSLNG